MKRSNTVLTVVMAGALAIIISLICLAADDPKSLFIDKNYGNMKAVPRASCSEDYPDRSGPWYDNKLIKYCSYGYIGNSSESPRPKLSITIFFYDKSANIVNEIVVETLSWLHKGQEIDLKSLYNKSTVSYCLGKRKDLCYTQWVSGDKRIKMVSFGTKVPEPILKDYLAKYPSTAVFSEDVFNENRAFKTEISKRFDIINETEPKRGPVGRKKEPLREMLYLEIQCDQEQLIRCWLGMTNSKGAVNCPIALSLNDADRKKKWLELNSEVANRNIVVNNMEFINGCQSKCPDEDPNLEKTMIDILGIKP